MHIKQKSAYFLMIIGVFLFFSSAHAATTPTSLTLTYTTGDAVQVSVSGKESSKIQLSYLPPGAPVLTTIVLGTTDTSGKFSTSISSGGYGIPSGSPVFASIIGVQSGMILWPTYTSTLTLTETSVHIAVGQSVTVGGSATLILAANSQSTSISTSISGSQLTITGMSSGSGTVTVCGASVGCGSVAVEVGAGTDQAGISFNKGNPVMRVQESSSVTIFGGGTNGYTLKSNSNPAVIDPSLGVASNALWIFGKAAGTSTVTICSVQYSTDCANLTITVLSDTVATLSFTPNNLVLIPGLTQSSTIFGGPDSSYYISSNTNSGVAQATISGKVVTVIGGSTVGSTVITVCSTTVNNTCGGLNVVLNSTSAGYSSTTLTFSQNVVSLPQGETSNVTVTGGNNSGYSISSNSDSNVVTASVNGTSNVVNLYGNAVGSAIVSVCATSAGTTCASLYVTVSPALSTVILSANTIALTLGEKKIVSIVGGNSKTTVYANSNTAVVSTFLSSDGAAIVLTGGTTVGTSVVTVCPTDAYSSKCATVSATVNTTTIAVPNSTVITPPAISGVTLLRAEGDSKVYVVKDGKKQWIKSAAEFNAAGYKWSNIVVTTSTALAAYPDMTVVIVKVKIVGTPVLRVRQLNNTKSTVVDGVKKDEIFDVLKEESGWYKIKTSIGITGWISGTYAMKQ
ncbi:MAG: SH3 domain-containing protein [bacterium]|nr:SH3 domain-containing protein [bacterium]